MSPPDNITFLTTNWRGGSRGDIFCDHLSIADIATSAIKQITMIHDDVIYSIGVLGSTHPASWSALTRIGDRLNTRGENLYRRVK